MSKKKAATDTTGRIDSEKIKGFYPFLKMREVAKLLGISESTAYELARAGIIPAKRVGEVCVRVDRADFISYIENLPPYGP